MVASQDEEACLQSAYISRWRGILGAFQASEVGLCEKIVFLYSLH